ncbi:MAG: hypothetical protein D6813_01775 [Calditrichaeota bacterium]|nr:MAG: hypothetical protein D6813_01775 [Calditrichota bacterium]
MPVMQNMREYTKIILIILVLAFIGTIVFDWGMNILGLKQPRGIIGEVNGVEITDKQFYEAYANRLDQYRNQTKTEPTESQLEYLRNQVWEDLVQDILIRQELEKRGIRAYDAEIVYRIFNMPPDILKKTPGFQNDKKQFDMAKYQAALNNPANAQLWKQVEDYLRITIPREDLQQRLQSTVHVTDDMVKREYLKQNQKVKVKYIFIPQSRFIKENIEIADATIQKYYDEHKDEFREEEKRKIQYVIFPLKTSAEDSAEVRKEAEELMERLKEGEDFAELAEIYSDDPGTRDKGGDLGFFGKGEMVKPFEDAVFSAKPGEIVGPVETQFGLHIIKVEERKIEKGKPKVHARHILLKFQPSEKSREQIQDDAYLFADEVKTRPFEEVAKEFKKYDLKVQTSAFFPKGSGFVPGIGLNKQVSNFIFKSDVGTVGEVEETPQGFFVYKIVDIQKERIKPLEEVKTLIKNKLLMQKRMEMARDLAQKVYDKIQNGSSFEEVAKQDSLELKTTEEFTRSGVVPGVGREPRFIGAAFALEKPGQVSHPVEGTRGYYIIQLIQKSPFDQKDFEAKKESIRQELIQRKLTQVFTQWYANLKAKAEIKDYRDRYF